jgi:LysM repeat protein
MEFVMEERRTMPDWMKAMTNPHSKFADGLAEGAVTKVLGVPVMTQLGKHYNGGLFGEQADGGRSRWDNFLYGNQEGGRTRGSSMQERASRRTTPSADIDLPVNSTEPGSKVVGVDVNTGEAVTGTMPNSPPGQQYRIKEGATLWDMAGGDMQKVKELAAYNNIQNPDLIIANAGFKVPETMHLNNLNRYLQAI